MTNENVGSVTGSVNNFIESSVKRDTPKKLTIEDLFYLYDAEMEGHKPFYQEAFIKYYQSLTDKKKLNLRQVFNCLIRETFIRGEFKYYSMHFSTYDAGLKEIVHFKLPHNNFFKYFFLAYLNSEISCEVTFDEILKFLELK
jgi:hypothetical protein